jgi:hypothetical protein
MVLRDYAADILGSKTSIRLLRTLARYEGKVFTVREPLPPVSPIRKHRRC